MLDRKLIKGFYRRVLNEYKYLENIGGKDEDDDDDEEHSDGFETYSES